ncbi:hypothetical protein ACFRCI_13080 [Streptomyces sp. NPDC056638]|uniref:hypothetical protein n=1 Tax=Streptomyces sp. NPDC056638 TaxID=3345887 RepID=UPI00369DCE0A
MRCLQATDAGGELVVDLAQRRSPGHRGAVGTPGVARASACHVERCPAGRGDRDGHRSRRARALDLFEERLETAQLQALLKARADNPSWRKDPYDYNGDGVADTTCTGGKRVSGFYGFGIVNALWVVK